MELDQAAKMKQPKSLRMLFFAEMWERFSYYGMRGLLTLYMTKELLFNDTLAAHTYGAYGALVYATPFLGGLIADRLLGHRKAVILGGILMAIGHFVLALPGTVSFYAALAFLIVGNGFFKPNISSMVGGLYKENDPRRDAGFTIFYMGINLGAFLAPLICGTIGELFGWHYGFGLAGIGMVAGLLVFNKGKENLGENNGVPPKPEKLKTKLFAGLKLESLIYILAFAAVPIFALGAKFYGILDVTLMLFIAGIILGLLVLSFRYEKVSKERIWVILLLLLFTTIFWSFFELAGSALTLFTDRNVDRTVFGFTIPASTFQSVNPFFIILLGPLFANLWISLNRKNREPSTPVKFALGIIQLAMGFGAYYLGVISAPESGLVSVIYLILGYLLQTTGELCLSPIGLSMVTKLSPKAIVAMVMGAWFLSSSAAHLFSGKIASLTSVDQYKETALTYTPEIAHSGTDTVKVVAFTTAERKDEKGEEVKDSTGKVIVDTLRSQKVTVVYNTLKDFEEVKQHKDYQVSTYTIRKSLQPRSYSTEKEQQFAAGEALPNGDIAVNDTAVILTETVNNTENFAPDTTNYRSAFFDPLGDLTTIEILQMPSKGQLDTVKDKPDHYVYTPKEVFTGTDTVQYTMTSKAKPDRKDTLLVVYTVDTAGTYAPIAFSTLVNTYLDERGVFHPSGKALNISNLFYIPNGEKIELEITKQANLKTGYAKIESALNPFMGPDKTIHIYGRVFGWIAIVAAGAGLILLLLVPIIRRWMHGVN